MFKRSLLLLIGAFILAFLAPVSAGSSALAAAAVIVAGLLLSVAVGRSVARRDAMLEAVATELNKIRRVYHLGKNLGMETRHRQWFTDLHGHLYAYLTAFDKKHFSQYQEMNGLFRKLSYHLYQIPSLDTEKERVLYRELLEAAGIVAGTRQRIQELWNDAMPQHVWNGLLVLTVLAVGAVLSAMGPSDRFSVGLVLTALGSALFLARAADTMPVMVGEDLSKRYVENIARLELSRHE